LPLLRYRLVSFEVSRIQEVGMKKRIVFALVTAFVLLVPVGIASAG